MKTATRGNEIWQNRRADEKGQMKAHKRRREITHEAIIINEFDINSSQRC